LITAPPGRDVVGRGLAALLRLARAGIACSFPIMNGLPGSGPVIELLHVGRSDLNPISEVRMTVDTEHYPTARPRPGGPDDASLGQLASQLSAQVSRLVHDELALAQVEAKRKAKQLGLGFGMFGASGALAFFAVGCLVAAGVLGVATVVSAWLAALIVAGVLLALAGATALTGKKGVRRGAPPVPTEAIESAKADVAAVREAVRR
jgi:hypothetical protein